MGCWKICDLCLKARGGNSSGKMRKKEFQLYFILVCAGQFLSSWCKPGFIWEKEPQPIKRPQSDWRLM